MILTEQRYFIEASLFLEKLFSELQSLSIDYVNWDIDHLCYRTKTLSDYQQVKNEFSSFCDLLVETSVNERLIATYKLKRSWVFGENFIDLIEIPQPKQNKLTKHGFEHIEVVMPKSFNEIKNIYPELIFEDTKHYKDFNPELIANLKSGAIKFHHQSLEIVINIEKMENAFNNIKTNFKFPNFPFLITGIDTIGIKNLNSPLDVFVSYQKEKKVELLEWIQSIQDKTYNPRLKIHNDSMTFYFEYENQKYRFNLSTDNLYTQKVYRIINLQMRLLKIFGSSLKHKVETLIKNGYTIEDVFIQNLKNQLIFQQFSNNFSQLESLSDLAIFNSK